MTQTNDEIYDSTELREQDLRGPVVREGLSEDYWASIGVSALGIPGEGRESLVEGPASAKAPR